MKKALIKLALLMIILVFNSIPVNAETSTILSKSKQLILVTTSSWDTQQGSLQLYQRSAVSRQWKPIGNSIPVVIGKNGMGWGVDFSAPNSGGPIKMEGDGKSPAGIYAIGRAFGFSDHADKNIKLDYLSIIDTTFCVDDEKSKYYNQVIHDTSKIRTPDWHSGEEMHTVDPYKWGAIVKYNMNHPVSGRGSCIFMHIWRDPESGTAGCVAMEESNMKRILTWLDPTQKPAIALLPADEYKKLQKKWRLPS